MSLNPKPSSGDATVGSAGAAPFNVTFNPGRSEFAFATFNLTYGAAAAIGSGPMASALSDSPDPYMFVGSCNLAAAAAMSWVPSPKTSGMLTVSPPPGAWAANMSTADIRSLQTAGCTSAAWVRTADGIISPACDAAGNCVVDTPATQVFWTSVQGPNQARAQWALRQTTCGADGSVCSSYRHTPAGGSAGAIPCGLRTEAILVVPAHELMLGGGGSAPIATETTPPGGSSVRTFRWTVTVVELGSSDPWPLPAGATATGVLRRQTQKPFQMTMNAAGSVMEALPVGGSTPPMIISVQSSNTGFGGTSSATTTGDSTATMTWQTSAYVKQGSTPVTVTTFPPVMAASPLYTPLWTFNGAASRRLMQVFYKFNVLRVDVSTCTSLQAAACTGTCAPWTQVADGLQLPGGNTSTFSCALPGCAPIPQNSVPSSVLMGFATNETAYWLQYYLKIICTVDCPATNGDMIVPPGTFSKKHFLKNIF